MKINNSYNEHFRFTLISVTKDFVVTVENILSLSQILMHPPPSTKAGFKVLPN